MKSVSYRHSIDDLGDSLRRVSESKLRVSIGESSCLLNVTVLSEGKSVRDVEQHFHHPNPLFWRLFYFERGQCIVEQTGDHILKRSGFYWVPPKSFNVSYGKSHLRWYHVDLSLDSGIGLELPIKSPIRFSPTDEIGFREPQGLGVIESHCDVLKAVKALVSPHLSLLTDQSERWSPFRIMMDKMNSVQPAKVRISDLAAELALNSSTLSKRFQREMGYSLKSFIIRYHLNEAEDLLRIKTLTLSKIANILGHPSLASFHRFFSTHSGMTPKEFRVMIG